MERHGYCYEEKNITSANFFDWNDYHMDYVVIDGCWLLLYAIRSNTNGYQ